MRNIFWILGINCVGLHVFCKVCEKQSNQKKQAETNQTVYHPKQDKTNQQDQYCLIRLL